MVKNALARRAKGEKGFTLVELLVVVIIIGILAAVSVPIYLNQRKKAWDSSAESDVKNAQTNVETAVVTAKGQFETVKGDCGGNTSSTNQNITVTYIGTDNKEHTDTDTTLTCSANNTVSVSGASNTYDITGWHDHDKATTYVYHSNAANASVHDLKEDLQQ